MTEEKSKIELYRQRAQAFQLAAAFARELKIPVGIRYDKGDVKKEWPVLSIELPNGQIALHIWYEDLDPVWLNPIVAAPPFDDHSNAMKEERILKTIRQLVGSE